MAYIYRHIRKDTQEVFYIGIGSDKNYGRSKNKIKRNSHWKSIVKITDYEVEIIMDEITWDEACRKEKEFIALYGRRDLNKGTLTNMTDGGDGRYKSNHSEETKRKLSLLNKGKKLSQQTKIKIGLASKGKVYSNEMRTKMREGKLKTWNSKTIVLDLQTGIYYKYITEAADSKGINRNTLDAKLRGRIFNNTSLIIT